MSRNPDHLLVLRRQLLNTLRDLYPAVAETRDLLESAPLLHYEGFADEVREELKALLAWGYVENLRGQSLDPPWWRITGAGVAQIRGEARPLDARIWGKLAIA